MEMESRIRTIEAVNSAASYLYEAARTVFALPENPRDLDSIREFVASQDGDHWQTGVRVCLRFLNSGKLDVESVEFTTPTSGRLVRVETNLDRQISHCILDAGEKGSERAFGAVLSAFHAVGPHDPYNVGITMVQVPS